MIGVNPSYMTIPAGPPPYPAQQMAIPTHGGQQFVMQAYPQQAPPPLQHYHQAAAVQHQPQAYNMQQQPMLYYVVQTPQGQQLVPMQQTYAPVQQMAPPQLTSSPPASASGSQTVFVQPPYVQLAANSSQNAQPIYVMSVPTIPSAETSQVMMSGSASHGASTTTRPPTDVNIWGFAVVDQYHPSLQRIPVPPSVVTRTRGMTVYNNDVQASSTKPCASTVCLRFTTRTAPLQDSCPSGEHCTGFHVERSYLEAARRVSEPLCCGLHNDYFSQEMLHSDCAPQLSHQRFTLVLDDRAEVELTLAQVALTIGLDQLTSRGVAGSSQTKVISLRKQVCRLHFEGKCKWTKDCGHVHLCRELHRFLLSFHFPSLSFLLATEPDVNRLIMKLNEEPQLLQYVKSKCVLPMITQLLDSKKYGAIEAIVSVGGNITAAMKDAILGYIATDPAGTESLNQKLSKAVVVSVPEAVEQRFRPAGRPAAPSPARVPSSAVGPPAGAPLTFGAVDPLSIWSRSTEAGDPTADACLSPTTRMPAFSPGTSVTSLQGQVEGKSPSQQP